METITGTEVLTNGLPGAGAEISTKKELFEKAMAVMNEDCPASIKSCAYEAILRQLHYIEYGNKTGKVIPRLFK